MAYNYKVRHISANKNTIVDYLSCLLTLPGATERSQNAPHYSRQIRTFKCPIQMVRVVSEGHIQYDHDLLNMAQKVKDDPDYCALIKCIVEKNTPSPHMKPDLRCYKSVFKDLSIEPTPAGNLVILEGSRIVIPLQDRKQILEQLQKFHSSQDQMYRIAKQTLFWPTLKNDILNVFERFSICQVHRRAKIAPPSSPLSHFC